MSANTFDVVIVGAGIAGCAAAIRLRQFNHKVCLLDEVSTPAFKVGESLPGAAIRLLDTLGIQHIGELLSEEDYELCLANASAWGTEEWTFNDAIRNPEGGGWHLVRNRFDTALLNYSQLKGAEFIPRKVSKVNRSEAGYAVRLKNKYGEIEALTARWVIDATGRSSTLLKQWQIRRQTFESQFAAVAWLAAEQTDEDSTTRIKSVENGWWYSSRLPDGSRVLSFQGLPKEVAELVRAPEQFLTAAAQSGIVDYPFTASKMLAGVMARDASISRLERSVVDQCLAVGDAALAFDPISSQGMFFALYSGIRGAECIARAEENPEQGAYQTQAYAQKVDQVFQANQNARKYYYTMEQRFTQSPYWSQYRTDIKKGVLLETMGGY